MRTTLLALCCVVGLAQAAPSGWYWWENQHTGLRICAQVSPGDGWLRLGSPYKNSRCTR